MAETATAAHLKDIYKKLADEELKKFGGSDLKKLERILTQIQSLLIDASREELTNRSVKRWLDDLQHVAYKLDDVLDAMATEILHPEESEASTSKLSKLLPACCTKFPPVHKERPKLVSIITQLEHLYKVAFDLGLTENNEKIESVSDEKLKSARRFETSSLIEPLVVGRVGEKEKLLEKLFEDDQSSKENFSILPIVGMGGVGKTTLARLLYNDTKVQGHFELKAWVCVSDDFNILRITDAILQSVTRETKEFKDLNQLQMSVIERFKGKRFLLVVDDVWSDDYEEWENLVRPFHYGAPGSKIILTTRKERLLRKLGIDHIDILRSLSHDDALSLFALHALGVDNFDSHTTLKTLGEGIVKKCDGLPLALKAIARLLRTRINGEYWDDVLNSEIWYLENSDRIVPALMLSYHDLSANLKRMFAYCSLFPKDYLFNKEELISLWMAEGYLNPPNASRAPEHFGQESFEELFSRSFFEPATGNKSLFVMHDLINDMATYVAGDIFLRFEMYTRTTEKDLEKYLHMSFIREEYVPYGKFEVFKRARNLRTMLAVSVWSNQSWDVFYLSSKILVDILPEFPMLRVLCLSHFEISEVPDFIGNLKFLRYLNLSQTGIKELPENVGNLHDLHTLIVFGCMRLTKLPKSFSMLKRLRHFDIRDTPLLEKLPSGIGELKSLHTLTKIIIEGDNGFKINELKGLINLQGEISIQSLHNVQSALHVREANLSLKKLTKLELKWDDGPRREALEKEVLDELKPYSDCLGELAIVSYGGLEFSNWVGDPSFIRLVHVSIRGCRKCKSLPSLGQLPSLKELFIQGMDRVENIDSDLTGTTYISFPSLEVLGFEDMPQWKIWSIDHVSDVVFPCLRELSIKHCPKLIEVLVEKLPLLRVLKIDRCGDAVLRHLVQAASSITKLEILSILGLTDEVWRGIIDYLGAVEEIRIYRCNEIKYLWESEAAASKVLLNLKKLYAYNCSLVSLGEKEDEEGDLGSNLMSSLKILDVWHCNNMERCCCPDSIESLCIGSCSSLTRVFFSTAIAKLGGGHKLKSLDISLCNKQMEKIDNTHMPMLEYIYIYHWTNLKSITQLINFIHLTQLELFDCPSIESFPDLQLFTSLQFLLIEKCPSMDYSFPSGRWPPNLVTLGIGGLQKPISEWGPQDFPTSLVDLTLYGEDVIGFHELYSILPSSLTRLCIEEFDNLESLLVGLQHLTSLQHLFIFKCPKIRYLPRVLLPSLLSLNIIRCRDLEERCNGRGSHYWPLISHIPCIELEYSD